MKGLDVLHNFVCHQLARLMTIGLVTAAGGTAFAEEAAPVDTPVPVEARRPAANPQANTQARILPYTASEDAASAAIPTDNSNSIDLLPPKVQAFAPPLGTSFEGIPDTGFTPPDANIAVGPTFIVQVVNGALRVTDRTGFAPEATIFLDFVFGAPAGSMGLTDPVCHYDHFSNRFVVMCTARNAAGTDGWYVLAVTKSSIPYADPAVWTVYYIRNDITLPNTDTATWGDSAKFGFDNTYFYITSNQYNAANQFQFSKIRIYKKNDVYGKLALSPREFSDVRDAQGARAFSLQPAVTFGVPGQEYLVSCSPTSGNSITVYNIPVASVFVAPILNKRPVAVSAWTAPLPAPQKLPGAPLNSGDARLVGAVFRNSRLYTAHTVRRGTFPCAAHYLGVNTTNFTKTLDVTIGSASVSYYYPAIAVSNAGQLGTVLNSSSLTRYPSALYTQIDPNGTVFPLATLRAGEANYNLGSWGKYNGVAVDPSSPDRLWFNAAYVSTFNTWGTYVGSTSLFGGRQSNPASDAVTALKDQLLDWLKTTPVFGPALP